MEEPYSPDDIDKDYQPDTDISSSSSESELDDNSQKLDTVQQVIIINKLICN